MPRPSQRSPTRDEVAELLALRYRLTGAGENLSAFIARASPRRPPPRHIGPILSAIERARHRRMKVCISMPPRHAKTVTILHALVWWLRASPADTCAYFSYSDTKGWSKSRVVRELAIREGVQLLPGSENVAEWRTTAGGGLLAGGAGGGFTGSGVQGLLVIDDPYKNREEADSALIREKKREWFNEVVYTRLEGASVVVIHTRWRQDDLIGELGATGMWEVINLPAMAEEHDPLGRMVGEALWPERYDTAELADIRKIIGEFSFASLYQGRPRPRGATVFGPPTYYDPAKVNLTGCTMSIGADTATSEKTTADYSAGVALALRGRGADQIAYVREVIRKQATIPAFARELAALQQRHGHAPMHIESFGFARATPQILREISPGLRIHEIRPLGDKFQRAQGVAAAWNQGRVMVPLGASWLPDFLAELAVFTGVNDHHDDQADALAHAWNEATAQPVLRAL